MSGFLHLEPATDGVRHVVIERSPANASPNGIVGWLRLPDPAELACRSAWRLDRRPTTERAAAALGAR